MTKIVQWYVKRFNQRYLFNNCFPWNDGLDLSNSNIWKLYNNKEHYYCRNAPMLIENYMIGKEDSSLEIKIIGEDEYDSNDINLMPFILKLGRFELFDEPRKYPFKNLDSKIIQWIKSHPELVIIWLDYWEAKNITNRFYNIIPGLYEQKSISNIDNKQIWINGTHEFENFQSKWLTITGSNPWITMIYSQDYTKSKRFEQYPLLLDVEKFDSNIFGYFGLQRIGRYRLLSRLYEEIGRDFWHTVGAGKSKEIIDSTDALPQFEQLFYRHIRYADINDLDILCELKKDIQKYCEINVPAPRNNLPDNLQEKYKNYGANPHLEFANKEHFKNIFLNIVSETAADRCGIEDDLICFSEKILKPIYAGRPFIVAANGNYLRELKKLGFKTFDKWWDESYDDPSLSIIESVDRIVSICKMVNEWDDKKVIETFEEMKPILEHNRKVLDEYSSRQPLWLEKVKKLLDK